MVYVYNSQTRMQEWKNELDTIQLERLKSGEAEIRTIIEPNNNGVLLPIEMYFDNFMIISKVYKGAPKHMTLSEQDKAKIQFGYARIDIINGREVFIDNTPCGIKVGGSKNGRRVWIRV
jgi:hypothetical protein